jgi:nitroimidazol reductase NimA-like FMN-containing flavoprotein (pyridoxamine 5'-phosphate oxidase superfamily)
MTYHMRRKDKEITDPSILKKILKSAKYITIALSMNNQPYLVTLSHGYDENRNCIYFHCAAEGKKIDYLKSNDTVWGTALLDYGYSEGECNHLFASVHFHGRVAFISNPNEKRLALECMIRQLEKNPSTPLAKLSDLDPRRLEATTFGRIDIDYMSGKKTKEINV